MASEWDVDWRENSGFEYLQTRKISNCTKEWIGCYVVIVHAEQTGFVTVWQNSKSTQCQ